MNMPRPFRPRVQLLLLFTLLGCSLGCRVNDAGYDSYIRAIRAMKGGDSSLTPADAESLLDEAVRLAPDNAQYRRARSGFMFDRGDYRTSLEDSLKAAELEGPGSSYPYYTAGLAAGALGSYEEARKFFNEAIRRQPSNGQYYAGLAFAEFNLKRYDVALSQIEKAIQLEPNFQRWHYTRGLILSRSGKKEEAISEFSRTTAFSKAQAGGGVQDIHFDGDREFARCSAMQAEELSKFWHYGGRWLSEQVYAEYRNGK